KVIAPGRRCAGSRVLVAFGEFARLRGASVPADPPAHVDGFVAMRVASFRRGREAAAEVCGGIEQMLAVVLPSFERTGRPYRELPFARALPGFFEYLAAERGLRPESIVGYRHHLACFEAHLGRIGVTRLHDLSPAILSSDHGLGPPAVTRVPAVAAGRVVLGIAQVDVHL